jgi:hypothetical protein
MLGVTRRLTKHFIFLGNYQSERQHGVKDEN